MSDNVNHPAHHADGKIEATDFMEEGEKDVVE